MSSVTFHIVILINLFQNIRDDEFRRQFPDLICRFDSKAQGIQQKETTEFS